MAVGKKLKKVDINSFDDIAKKARDLLKKDNEETLEDVAQDIDNGSTTTVGQQAEGTPIVQPTIQQTQLGWWLEWVGSTTNTTTSTTTPAPIINPNPIWGSEILQSQGSEILQPQGWNIGDRIQELVQQNNLQLQTDPALIARSMEQEGYKFDTTPIDTSKYENETRGMTVEEAAKYIDQKTKEEKAAQDAYNQEVSRKYEELNAEQLLKWDSDVSKVISWLSNIENPGMFQQMVWGIKDALNLWKSSNAAEREADTALTSLVWMSPKNVVNSTYFIDKWDWEEDTTHDEFLYSLREYVEDLDAYEKGETDEKPTSVFKFGTNSYNPTNPYAPKIYKDVTLTDDNVRQIVNVYNETLEEGTKDTKIKNELKENLRTYFWLSDDETIKEIDGTYKIVKTRDQDRVTQTNELSEEGMSVIVDRWKNDPNFIQQNSARKMLVYQEAYTQLNEKAQDAMWYYSKPDEMLVAIDSWEWTFASDEEKELVKMKIIGIKNMMMNNVTKPFIMNSADIIWITSQFAWDEKALLREYANKAWVTPARWNEYTVLSDAYMVGIDEPQRGMAWYDVANRYFNAIKPYMDELDDIGDRYGRNNFFEHQRHDLSAGMETAGQALEGAREFLWLAMDLVWGDAGKMAAWETQIGVFKKDYDLAWDAGRFIYSVEGKIPEVSSFFVWGWEWAIARSLGWISALWRDAIWVMKKLWMSWVVNKVRELWEWIRKNSRLWKFITNVQNNLDSTGRTLNQIRKFGESWQDVAKAEALLTKTILRNRIWQTFGKTSREIVESVWQDGAFFNRRDTEYGTQNQDKWTVYWALFSFANLDMLSMTWWGLKQFSNAALDAAGRWLWNVALLASNTVLDRWLGKKVIDWLTSAASKTIGRWGMVTWTTVDLTSYFYKHPSELSSAVLRSMWWDTKNFINALKNASWDDIEWARKMISSTWQSLFYQSQEAARILNILKRNDPTGLIAVWEKQYVGAMLSSFLRGKNTVNIQELTKMIEDSRYRVPDLIKRFYNTPWTLTHNEDDSKLFLKIDSAKMSQVEYPRELDFVWRNWEPFSPARTRTEDDIVHANRELDRMNSGLKDVFDPANINRNFTDLWDGKYILNKEWLESLWYKNNKLIPEVVAQVSEDTQQFVSKLREINESNGVEVLSEKLISDIEQTDAYSRLSSQLWDYLC